jgi:hypothetical protein
VGTAITLISGFFTNNLKMIKVIGIAILITIIMSAITGSIWYVNHRFKEYETTITNLRNVIIDAERNNTALTNNNLVLSKALDDQNEQMIKLRNDTTRKINELNAFIKMERKDRYSGKLKDVLTAPDDDNNLTALIDKAKGLKYEDF